MTGMCSRKVTGDSHLFVQLCINGGQRSLSRLQLAGRRVVPESRPDGGKEARRDGASIEAPVVAAGCNFSAPCLDQSLIVVSERNGWTSWAAVESVVEQLHYPESLGTFMSQTSKV